MLSRAQNILKLRHYLPTWEWIMLIQICIFPPHDENNSSGNLWKTKHHYITIGIIEDVALSFPSSLGIYLNFWLIKLDSLRGKFRRQNHGRIYLCCFIFRTVRRRLDCNKLDSSCSSLHQRIFHGFLLIFLRNKIYLLFFIKYLCRNHSRRFPQIALANMVF